MPLEVEAICKLTVACKNHGKEVLTPHTRGRVDVDWSTTRC